MDLAKIRKKSRSGPVAPDAGDAPKVEPEGVPEAPASSQATGDPGLDPMPDDASPSAELPIASAENVSVPEIAPEEARATTGERLLVFDLDEEKYAIPIHEIAQIIQMPRVTPVPNAPHFLSGIFSLRGRIVSIIDVARRLGLDRPPPEDPKVVVLDMGSDHFGLLVDRIDLVVEVNLGSLEPVPEGFKPVLQEFVEGVFHHKGRAVGFLNLPMFLAFDV